MSPIKGLSEPGAIASAFELGKRGTSKFIWTVCEDCTQGHWARIHDARKPNFTGLCKPCVLRRRNGKLENSPNWKGGIKRGAGYIHVYLPEGHPFRCMANPLGYVKRSRLVMAEHLGRPLKTEEEPHHEDENRSNDSLSNLRLFPSRSAHQEYHRQKEIQANGPRPTNKKGQYLEGGYHAD